MLDHDRITSQQELYLSFLPGVRSRYGAIPGVELIGLGAKERNGEICEEWAWRFYVKEKRPLQEIPLHEQIPAELHGVQTDVIVQFEQDKLVCDATSRVGDLGEYRDGGILGGSAIRNEYFGSDTNSGYGTLGILARKQPGNVLVGLTCAHVVNAAADTMTTSGLKIGQPRYWVSCCCCPRGRIGTVDTALFSADIDCAIITIDEDIRNIVTAVPADAKEFKVLGHTSSDPATQVIGAATATCFAIVTKRGQATGLTRGMVTDIAYGTNHMLIQRTDGGGSAPFACHGDSGAVVVNSSSQVIGLLVAADRADMKKGIVTHIKPVMQQLSITIAETTADELAAPDTSCPPGGELKAWPGGHADSAFNIAEPILSTDFGVVGAGDWNVTTGAGGAQIVEKDGAPVAPTGSVTGASSIKVRYSTVSASANAADAVKITLTQGGNTFTKSRIVFQVTAQPINRDAALNAANTKRFLATGGSNSTCGVDFPAMGGVTRYLAKAEFVYNILPTGITTWTSNGIRFPVGNAASEKGNIRSQRETKFCRGEQATGAPNRIHTDQATWVSAGNSSLDDYQGPSAAAPNNIFRLANKGFNPLHEGTDINHDSFNPSTYLQRYVRAHYRDFLQIYNGTAWVDLTPKTEWSVNLTAVRNAGGTAPPDPGPIGVNLVIAGLNAEPVPNTQPVIAAIATQEVGAGRPNATLTAVPTDPDFDLLSNAPPPQATVAFVRWRQTSPSPPAIVLTPNPALPNTSVLFTAPADERVLTFEAITNDVTSGLSRAAAVPALPALPNYQSVPVTATVNVVEWKNAGGGDPVPARNMTEVFTAASFPLGAATLDFDVTTGGIPAVIIEMNGAPIAPTGSVAGAASIRVRYDTRSGDLTIGQTVRILATNTGTGNTWGRRRTVFRITVAVHATDGAPPHTHLIPSNLGAPGQDHFCTAQGQGNSVFQATILPAPNAADITWDAGAFPFTVPSVAADRTTAHISSATGTGQDIPFTVRIGGDTCYNGRYWTIWSSVVPTIVPAPAGPVIFGAAGNRFTRGIIHAYTIEPATIITAADIPNLTGANQNLALATVNPPDVPAGDVNVANSGAGVLSGGASMKWDVSRQIRRKAVNVANIPATTAANPFFYTTFLNYPSDNLCGNDDQGVVDEDNDPYTAVAVANIGLLPIGQIGSFDGPGRLINHADGAVGDTFEVRNHFREFARVLLDTHWYPISGFSTWRLHFLGVKRSEAVDGIDYDLDGAQTKIFWVDNGTIIDTTNAGF